MGDDCVTRARAQLKLNTKCQLDTSQKSRQSNLMSLLEQEEGVRTSAHARAYHHFISQSSPTQETHIQRSTGLRGATIW